MSAGDREALLAEVVDGLTRVPKRLPTRMLYDPLGSALFEAITRTPEYYPTACEREILKARAEEIALVVGPGAAVVELGSGTSAKVPILLATLRYLRAYVPVDIDADTLRHAAARLRLCFPGLPVVPLATDFTGDDWAVPEEAGAGPILVFYAGSTLGNLEPGEVVPFLRRVAARLRPGDRLLLGCDLEKDVDVLLSAYDDPVGVTAAFNRNLLAHLNRALGTDFDPRRYAHVARWNPEARAMEMHLRSRGDQVVTVGDRRFELKDGETIHTESSHKFTRHRIAEATTAAGFEEERWWTDRRGWFAVGLYRLRDAPEVRRVPT